MHLQNLIHRITVGGGPRVLRLIAAFLGFLTLTFAYDLHSYKHFTSNEAMESAQLARNLASGEGYSTDVVRPVDICLLKKHVANAPYSSLNAPLPDLGNAPAYPALLAGFFKVLPYNFGYGPRSYPQDLELWVLGLNQALFFLAALLLFKVAADLFDKGVAWVATVLFVVTDLYWRFSLSGLSTMFLIVLFLGVVWCLGRFDKRSVAPEGGKSGGIGLALFLGVLIGIGGLTRYSFAWLILPVLAFLSFGTGPGRGKVALVTLVSFAAVLSPWLIRNYTLTGNLFGTAGFTVFQNTPAFPGDTLERSFDLTNAMSRIYPQDYLDKLFINLKEILANGPAKLCGNWISAFFLAGLLVPFRNQTLSRIRYFLIGSIAMLLVVQALGQTHVTTDMPVINSENLLVLVGPMLFIFGAAFFFTLLEQLQSQMPELRNWILGGFVTVLAAPFIFVFLAPPSYPNPAPFDPYYIQRIVRWTGEQDLMASDVPTAVAWYGRQTCAFLPLNHNDEFARLNAIKPVRAIYLTQKTTDHFMGQTAKNKDTWERFALDSWANGVVPDTFPLTNAPTGFLPDRIFMSDTNRWSTSAKR